MASDEPSIRVDFGRPIVFFDSHPDEQEGYIYSYWSGLKSSLKIAWTGEVPKFHETGVLRIYFWTIDGTQGLKDYELREYQKVKEDWNKLLDLPDVRRALVMGYSGQNPYTLGNNPWVEKFQREAKKAARAVKEREEWDEKSRQRKRDNNAKNLIDFDELIEQTELAEYEKELRERERQNERRGSSENDRLLEV
ncbi:uncharacterized protein RAG0_04489 [Rhynchosporium agropyri]|uniref:Uncharacterized protein n=1 Tax=Rhynchosporium agropyri TaxID=914238 RepID=A0A1E1K954_9HELO|nr:uncharacterized protein RAG0_04489 [Rhynchosporium agropyri]